MRCSSRFVTGALARFALPGPDPMPPWLTVAIGLVGGLRRNRRSCSRSADARPTSWAGLASFFVAVGLVVVYRRFVQKRPVWGRDAYRFPERGFGVEQYRERLKKAGIDPDRIGTQQAFGALQPRPPMQPLDRPRPTIHVGRRPDRESGALPRPARGAPRHRRPRRRPSTRRRTRLLESLRLASGAKRRSALSVQSPRDQRKVRTTIASRVRLVEVEAARLAEPSRPRLPEPGRDRDDGRARLVADDLELVPLAHGRLVDVTREDEVGAGVHERAEDVVAARDRPLARRPPRRADQVVVEDGDAERSVLCLRRAVRPRARAARRLSAPPWWRNGRAELSPTTWSPAPTPSARSSPRPARTPPTAATNRAGVYGRSWLPGTASTGGPSERSRLAARSSCSPAAAMREIAGRDDELRLEPLDEPRERLLDVPLLMCTHVEVGNMEEPRVHNRTRL